MGKKIIITAGPTNERIDAVMKITNMSTGSLGARIAEKILNTPEYAEQVDKLYYVSQKLARKPAIADNAQDGKLCQIQVESTQDLMNTLRVLLRNPDEHIDAVIHNAAVGDYYGRYTVRGEDLADEIAHAVYAQNMSYDTALKTIMAIIENPKCVQNASTKISSYEPNLMTMMGLTPKVISEIKKWSPNTMLIGSKLLEGVTNNELFRVASALRTKNNAEYVIANDLARINENQHWAMIIGENGVITECNDKNDIAGTVTSLVFGEPVDYKSFS